MDRPLRSSSSPLHLAFDSFWDAPADSYPVKSSCAVAVVDIVVDQLWVSMTARSRSLPWSNSLQWWQLQRLLVHSRFYVLYCPYPHTYFHRNIDILNLVPRQQWFTCVQLGIPVALLRPAAPPSWQIAGSSKNGPGSGFILEHAPPSTRQIMSR
jgi:hypothetical protein